MPINKVKCVNCKNLGELDKRGKDLEIRYHYCNCKLFGAFVPENKIDIPMPCNFYIDKDRF